MNRFFADKTRPFILGHRGSPAHHQENTLASFQHSMSAGADGVELDVFMTRDKKIVVFHDEDISRLTGVQGNITDLTWDEISKLQVQQRFDRGDGVITDYPSEQPIPLLEDALSALPSHTLFNIELKAYAPKFSRRHTGAEVAKIIRQTNTQDRVIATSFDFFMLHALEREFPQIHTGFAYDAGMLGTFGHWLQMLPEISSELAEQDGNQNHHSLLNYLLENNAVGRMIDSTVIAAEHVLIDSDTVRKIHDNNRLIGAYTLFPLDTRFVEDNRFEENRFEDNNVDHVQEAQRLKQLGVDWIETDDCLQLLAALG